MASTFGLCRWGARSTTLLALLCIACGPPEEPADDLSDRYGEVEVTRTEEPLEFTDDGYDFTGPDTIEDLLGVIQTAGNTWYGVSAEAGYPVEGPCDGFGAEVETVPEFPMEIEGIITLHPRYYYKPPYCGSEPRFYGSYFIEDATGGILVLKDSRVADFTFGDRVKLTVHGAMAAFGQPSVSAWRDEEVVSRGHAVAYEAVDGDLSPAHVGKTVRVRGRVGSEATNYNFNTLCLVPEDAPDDDACDPRCIAAGDMCQGKTIISVDREIGQRNPAPIYRGDVLEVTGPVLAGFNGPTIVVIRLGQITFVQE